MKKTIYIIALIFLAVVLAIFILFQTGVLTSDKFIGRSPVPGGSLKEYNNLLKSLAPNPDATSTLSAEEYEQLSASLAPTTDNAIPLEDSISDELRESLLPRN